MQAWPRPPPDAPQGLRLFKTQEAVGTDNSEFRIAPEFKR